MKNLFKGGRDGSGWDLRPENVGEGGVSLRRPAATMVLSETMRALIPFSRIRLRSPSRLALPSAFAHLAPDQAMASTAASIPLSTSRFLDVNLISSLDSGRERQALEQWVGLLRAVCTCVWAAPSVHGTGASSSFSSLV